MLFKTTHFIAFAAIMVTTTFAVPLLGLDGGNQQGQTEGGQGGGEAVGGLVSNVQNTLNCAVDCVTSSGQPLDSVDCIKAGCVGQQQQEGGSGTSPQ
ncbi:hypothetical protein O0I10_011719 [Lichtheimia ornata]|uniref:Extracellular membrane protein CFEM domain-containing protein n=1 Tax=Lichtheimia ornata TaxID=688661 RepID=A0AAD7XTU9_9FUNG|nr:uncharacterized protein O0I10_011719 [Lichtheimia ornata]KAJ8652641.1 hypothetical protein O0I10_011719 [Lichtheimia ornata]